ncbi:MAG: hypothetical protein J0H89_10815, partial [Rhizobiales bacterium]|nr:hypothetical protein [Hyphomicrobiales bacterium]
SQIARARMHRANGLSIPEIAYALCTSADRVRAAVEPNAHPKAVWTPARWQRAQDMRAAGETTGAIARTLGFTTDQVSRKFYNESQRTAFAARADAIKAALDRRDQRLAALERRTITGNFFGDPPPGYSALDSRQTQNRGA